MLVALLPAGCSSLNLATPTAGDDPPQTADVSSVQALWQDLDLEKDGRPFARGFAGRVYLMARGSDAPVRAPGSVSVYVFDDNTSSEKPLYKWQFEYDELKKTLEKTTFGWCYTLWLPCPADDQPHPYTLIVRHTSPEGRSVASSPAAVTVKPLAQSARQPTAEVESAAEGFTEPGTDR